MRQILIFSEDLEIIILLLKNITNPMWGLLPNDKASCWSLTNPKQRRIGYCTTVVEFLYSSSQWEAKGTLPW
jgi:hypothetical protein